MWINGWMEEAVMDRQGRQNCQMDREGRNRWSYRRGHRRQDRESQEDRGWREEAQMSS